MLKNKELVLKMSLEQRIRLIVSAQLFKSCAVENYKFPVFSLTANPVAEAEGKYCTLFPSDKTLCCTWDTAIIREIYRCCGNEAKAVAPYAYFNTCNDISKDGASEDYFLSGEFTAQKIRGLNLSGAFVNFENLPENESAKIICDKVFDIANPNSFLLHSVEEAEALPPEYRYEGLLYGVASCKEEVAKYLFFGCSIVFLKEDFTEELIPYLVSLTDEFNKAEAQYKAGKLTLAEFDRRQRQGEILNSKLIDTACDEVVSALLDLRENTPDSIAENRSTLDVSTHKGLFNEVLHDRLCYRAAAEGIVLLKNRNKILPLDTKTKIAVIGEYATNPEYQTELFSATPTAVRLPFEILNDYEIQTVGYAHGYLKGESNRADLITTALGLCADADCALVYLSAEKGARELPAGQKELLEALASNKVKYIAVVSADGVFDTSFADSAEAVLFTGRAGQAVQGAIADILTGDTCPSGRLCETFPVALPESGTAPAEDNVRFAFGFGLSYTSFEYRNLRVTEDGVSFTVFNTGACDGYAVAQLYIKKEGSNSTFKNMTLRGFARVFVKKNDAVKVEIPFDGNTFKSYDGENKVYRVEGGEYKILIAESAKDIMLNGSITLAEHIYGGAVHKSEVVKNDGMPVGFTQTKDDEIIRKEKKKLSFGLKLFFAIALTLYYDAVCGVLVFSNLLEKNLIVYIVLGVIFAVGNIFALVYIILIAKKRKYQKYMHPTGVLSDMVERVKNFKEIAKVTYEQPVPAEDPVIEEEIPEEEEEQVEEEKPASYRATFKTEESSAVYTKHASFTELCDNLRAYSLYKGVNLEPSSARALIAAFAAGKTVFIRCGNTEVVADFTRALNGWFGNTTHTTAQDGWDCPDDLLWVEESEAFVTSSFSNAVNSACGCPDKNCAAVVDNVKGANLAKYFADFIEYSLYPSEEHTLKLSDELSLTLPNNLNYLLIAADGTEELPPELASAVIQIDVIASKAETAGEEVEAKGVTYNTLKELVTEAREKYYLSEKSWKRIDELTEAINATERFKIGNKDILSLEKLSAVLMECGGDESEALILAFTSKIVPLLKNTAIYRGEKGSATLVGMVEKLFGDEDITAVRKAFKEQVNG